MWVETASLSFTARHASSDSDAALELLDDLERFRERLRALWPTVPANVTIVLHDSLLQLFLSQPYLAVARRLAEPEARRLMVSWCDGHEVHSLGPETLRRLARGQDSLRALTLAPRRGYALLVVASSSGVGSPFKLGSLPVKRDAGWLLEGAAAWLSGQLAYLRGPLARRLRRGAPDLPPSHRDAWLLGGTVFELLAEERGEEACATLACGAGTAASRELLRRAFDEPLPAVRARWHSHLDSRAAAPASAVRR
jgi:hypothetical protein